MLLKQKLRPSTSVLNNKTRPLRGYQKEGVFQLEEQRKLQHQTSRIAIIKLDSECGTGKDDMMYYFGQYTGLPGDIMMLAPEVAMIEKVQTRWPVNFAPHFTNPRQAHTATIQGLYYMFKKIVAGEELNTKQQSLYDLVSQCGTLFFNEVHKLSSGNDLTYIPVILKGLQIMNKPFTVVNVSACIEDINPDAWGVPLELGLVQTQGTEPWLNPTQVHTHCCGMSVTWEQVAMETGLDVSKLDSDVQNALSNAHQQIAEQMIYIDSDTAAKDIQNKSELNEKLKKEHPELQTSVGIFTEKSQHLLKLATIEDIVKVYFAEQDKKIRCIWYTYNNAIVDGKVFSYSDYLVQQINKTVGKTVAVEYNSENDRDGNRKIREDFENNRGHYLHIVCKAMLVEDFDKQDLLNMVNAAPVRDPKSTRRKQKYMRVRRPILTNPLDYTTNIKPMSHIYQATNIKQINDVGKRFNRDVIDLTVIKQMFPNANLDDPNILALLEGLLASSAETKMSVVDKKNDPFEKKDVDFESQDTNDIDDVLGGETWEEMVEKLQNETFIPPGAIVNLHKITDVQSGHSVSLGSRSYTDVFQVERFTDIQYEQWVKNKLILL